jgi:hypothetical protein
VPRFHHTHMQRFMWGDADDTPAVRRNQPTSGSLQRRAVTGWRVDQAGFCIIRNAP